MTAQRASLWLVLALAAGALAAGPQAACAKSQHVIHSGPSSAPAPAVTPPPPPAEPFPVDDVPGKSELAVDGLHASLAASDLTTTQTVGGTAFVTFTITDAGGNKSVQLSAEGDTNKVTAITGRGVQTSAAAGGLSAQIPLAANGPTAVIVQLTIKDGETGPGGKLHTRLRLKISPQKGGSDVAIVSLPVADCAGDYKKQLTRIIDERRDKMVGTLDAVSAAEPGWPSNWVFLPPKFAPPTPVAACKPQKGKNAVPCPAPEPAKTTADASKMIEDSRVFEVATGILQQKGALPSFQTHRQPMREASYTMLSSLREYMEQNPHPALCNGVDYMLNYYQSRTTLLREIIDTSKAALDRAKTVAASHVSELIQAASPQPGAWSGLAPEDLVAVVGGAILTDGDVAKLKDDKDIWAKLHRLKDALSGPTTASLTPERKASALAALQYIEAAKYLSAAVPKYQRLDENIYGTMSAIGTAHKDACVCGT